jgi:hypothetical protein
MEYTFPDEDAQGVVLPAIVPGVAGGPVQGHTTFCQAVPLQYSIQLEVEFKTINPMAGDTMEPICVADIRGGRNPSVVDVTSKAAEAFGVAVPIPTCPEAIMLVPAGAVLVPA